MPERTRAIERLVAGGLLRATGDRLEPTPRWRGAVARATLYRMSAGEAGEDLRFPFASALVEHFGEDAEDQELAEMVELLLGIEFAPDPNTSDAQPSGR